jgi:hypothetical protein
MFGVQYVFTAPSCVWVCNVVVTLKYAVSWYVPVSWCVLYGSDPLPNIPRHALHVAVGIVKNCKLYNGVPFSFSSSTRVTALYKRTVCEQAT